MKYLMLLLIIAMVLLAACDDRDTDAPEMTVVPSTTELYNEGNDQNYADIMIDLDGDNASTDSVRINVEYDTSLGTFNPDGDYAGNAYFIRTNSQGVATGNLHGEGFCVWRCPGDILDGRLPERNSDDSLRCNRYPGDRSDCLAGTTYLLTAAR